MGNSVIETAVEFSMQQRHARDGKQRGSRKLARAL